MLFLHVDLPTVEVGLKVIGIGFDVSLEGLQCFIELALLQ
jgi:hypothetical protein